MHATLISATLDNSVYIFKLRLSVIVIIIILALWHVYRLALKESVTYCLNCHVYFSVKFGERDEIILEIQAQKQNKLRGQSPRANYTGRATTACRRS
jgi:hypothetical protein